MKLTWTLVLAMAWGLTACDSEPTNAEEGEAGLSCASIDENAEEHDCGTWSDSDEESDGEGNDAVVACVAQAAADGRAFAVTLSYYRNAGQYDTTRTYHVAPDGAVWDDYSGYEDICTVDKRTLNDGVDLDTLAACQTWNCIETALGDTELVGECENNMNCDGV